MSWLSPEWLAILWAMFQALVILLGAVLLGAVLTIVERRLLGLWQDRYGPNRVGPFGTLQLVADMIKIFFKEDWIPPFADRPLFLLAPVIAFASLLLSFIIIPITPGWGVADLHIGLLFFLAMAGINVYAVLLGGWASGNKYALLGAMRSSAQTVSYEVFMGLSLMGVVALAGSFNMREIVAAQEGLWFVVPQFFGFCTFLIAGIAVTHRHPFDQPEAEQELADGYHIEYSVMKFGLGHEVRAVFHWRVRGHGSGVCADRHSVLWWLARPLVAAGALVRDQDRLLPAAVHPAAGLPAQTPL